MHAHESVLLSRATAKGMSYIACALGPSANRRGFTTGNYRLSYMLGEVARARADGPISTAGARSGWPDWAKTTGIRMGIAASGLPHIREPFCRRTRHGARAAETGLGLGVLQRLITLRLGELPIQSTPGAGVTFTVRWPAHCDQRLTTNRQSPTTRPG